MKNIEFSEIFRWYEKQLGRKITEEEKNNCQAPMRDEQPSDTEDKKCREIWNFSLRYKI